MRKTLSMWAVLAAMLFSITGCIYQDLEVLSVDDFSELRLSLDGMQARMDVVVYNPNPYAVTVTGAEVMLTVNDEVVGDVSLVEDQIIRPDAQITVPLRVATRDGALGRVLKNDLMTLLRGAQVPFVAEGSVTGKAFGLSFTVPLRHDQSLKIRP